MCLEGESMINKLKKIEILTKIFVKDFYQRTKLINKENNNINKKSVWFWIIILLGIAMTYISYKSISWLKSNGMPELFLTLYMMFTLFLLVLQTIAASSSVYFFSKDLEFILPLPVRPIELLVSKYNTLLIMLYSTEFVFSVLPFFLYGFMNYTGFKYFLLIAIILILIPIIIVSAISLITIILMKIFSFIKNRNIIQNIISFLLTMILCLIEFIMLGNTESLNKNFINTYIVETLYTSDLNLIWKNIGILIIVSIVTFIVFIIFGKNNYLKSILKSIVGKKVFFINKKAIKIKLKKTNIENLYIKKEIKNLLKHPIFFMQTVFPVIMILLTIIFIGNTLIPVFNNILENDQTLSRELATIDFNSELIVVILGILQVLFSISNLSITAVSRDGRDAVFMKYIPLDLYKQFKCKNVLQIMLNVIVAIIVLGMIYFYIPKIGIINIILLFIVSICINIINSYLMLIIDLRRPYLNWTSEHSVVKKNDNKSFQYAFTIIMILLYMYISNICKNLNVQITLIGEIIFFTSIIILIKIIVKKNIQKLFNKIN